MANIDLIESKIKITNTRSANEAQIDNAGVTSGPMASAVKFNAIAIPMPRTNLQVVVEPGNSITVLARDAVEAAHFMSIAGAIDGIKAEATELASK